MSKVLLRAVIKSNAVRAKLIKEEEDRQRRIIAHICNNAGITLETMLVDDPEAGKQNAGVHALCEQVRILEGLCTSRTVHLAGEQRSLLLASAYLRGKPYHKIEPCCYHEPSWLLVAEVVLKYGPLVMLRDRASTEYCGKIGVSVLQENRRRLLHQVADDLRAWGGDYVRDNRGRYIPVVDGVAIEPKQLKRRSVSVEGTDRFYYKTAPRFITTLVTLKGAV